MTQGKAEPRGGLAVVEDDANIEVVEGNKALFSVQVLPGNPRKKIEEKWQEVRNKEAESHWYIWWREPWHPGNNTSRWAVICSISFSMI